MQLHSLQPAKGATTKGKRIARGEGSGHGGTSTRGHKGDKSRSGSHTKRNFEGGQTPIQRRLPKVGFKNINRVEYVAVSLTRIQELVDKLGTTDITIEVLRKEDVMRQFDRLKLLGTGALTSKVNLTIHAASETAKAAFAAAGGTLNLLNAGK